MSNTPADWYPDPSGRAELRYFDGAAWTDDVSSGGQVRKDPIGGQAPGTTGSQSGLDRVDSALTLGNEGDPNLIREQIAGTGHRGAGISQPVAGGSGSIFDEPILVVNQKAKLIELSNQYSVFDQNGQQLAAVEQVGQSTARKALRLLSNVDQFLTHRLQIRGPQGEVLLGIERPAKFVKSKFNITNHAGQQIGEIVQENAIGKIRLRIQSNGQTLGYILAENWRAWNFRIEDANNVEVARVTKTWEGLAKTMFTTADNYVLQVSQRPPEPFNSIMIASALSIDTALKQDSRGLS